MSKYSVSVIIPVYNCAGFIDECINSLLEQTIGFSNIEVVFINDGSKDNSLEICKKYEEKYNNVKVLNQKNSGVSVARNNGIEAASGKYILFLDADDFLDKKSLKKLVSFFDKHYDEIDLVTYPIINLYENGREEMHFRYRGRFKREDGVYDTEEYYYLVQATINVMIKNNLDIKFNQNQTFSEDERFCTEVIMLKQKMGLVNSAKYYYRKHSASTNAGYSVNTFDEFNMIISYYEYLFDKYSKNGIVPKYIQSLLINSLRWRLADEKLLPNENLSKALKRAQKLVRRLDVDLILEFPYLNLVQKLAIFELLQSKLELTIKDDMKCFFVVDDKYEIPVAKPKNQIMRMKIEGNNLNIFGIVDTPIFHLNSLDFYISYRKANKKIEKKVELFKSYIKYTNKYQNYEKYGYEIDIDISDVNEIEFYVKYKKIMQPMACTAGRFAALRFCDGKYSIKYKQKRLYIDHANLYRKIANHIHYAKKYRKNFKILLYRFISPFAYNKKNIWIYNDRDKEYDNAYVQFKNDIIKNDGIKRYYIYNDDKSNLANFFDDSDNKCLVKFGSFKHKMLYLHSKKIISSFSDVPIYCPFNKSISKYKDLARYDLIYLQHGILYADLTKMYAKEFNEIEKIIVSSNFEIENLTNKYHFKKSNLILSGMPRLNHGPLKEGEKKIILAPSWRNSLVGGIVDGIRQTKDSSFLASTFYLKFRELLNSKKLINVLEKNDLILDFRLHPNFKEYVKYFDVKSKNILVNFESVDLSDYKAFITDFSSFQFDFVKLNRPIIYFFPDTEEFAAGNHSYNKVDLPLDDAFGPYCEEVDEVVDEIDKLIKSNFAMEKKYEKRMKEFFFDTENPCDIIYNKLYDKE